MDPAKTNQASVTEVSTNGSRREALKKFARNAAVAPTAMVLLQPREGHAGHGRGHGWGKGGRWGKGGKNHY